MPPGAQPADFARGYPRPESGSARAEPPRREAVRGALLREDVSRERTAWICRRIVNTSVSLAAIVLVQLNYVVAPRVWSLDRI